MSGQSGSESRSSRRRFVKKSETLDTVVEVLLEPVIGALPPVDGFTGGCLLLLVLGASLADLARARRDSDWLDAIVVAWLSVGRTVLP